jgi:isoquinoline 1-oxidoreductase beta subunit
MAFTMKVNGQTHSFEITVKNGRVEQTNFDTYQMLRMNEAPVVEVHIVQSSEAPGGMGEAGTSAIVPAVANAIFGAHWQAPAKAARRPCCIAAAGLNPRAGAYQV